MTKDSLYAGFLLVSCLSRLAQSFTNNPAEIVSLPSIQALSINWISVKEAFFAFCSFTALMTTGSMPHSVSFFASACSRALEAALWANPADVQRQTTPINNTFTKFISLLLIFLL